MEYVPLVAWETVNVIDVDGALKAAAQCPWCQHVNVVPAGVDGESSSGRPVTPVIVCEHCRNKYRAEMAPEDLERQ